jgi:hypothetical protein
MSESSDTLSIWGRYPDLSESELRALVAAAAQVLVESEDAKMEDSDDFLEISPKQAGRQIASLLLAENDSITGEQIQDLLEDEVISRQLSLAVLDEIRKHPALAEAVEARFEEATNKMGTPELFLLTGALVILAIRIKEIRWSRKGKTVSFYESGEAVKNFVTQFLNFGAG